MDLVPLHPKLVHVPIALAVLLPFISGGLLLAWWRDWLPSGTWVVAAALHVVLVGTAFGAMRTGEMDEERVEAVVSHAAMELHEERAEVFTWSAAFALLIFLAPLALRNEAVARRAALLATLASVVVLVLGFRVGEAGGTLVYEEGAAAAYQRAGPAVRSADAAVGPLGLWSADEGDSDSDSDD